MTRRNAQEVAIKRQLASLSFEEAKLQHDVIQDRAHAAGDVLRTFPRNAIGLVPDDVRTSATYRAAKSLYDVAFAHQRAFNGVYVKMFAKELSAERDARRKR